MFFLLDHLTTTLQYFHRLILKNSKTFSVSLLCFALVSIAQGAVNVLVSDSFNRTNNTDLNADTAGKSGSLGTVDWSEISHKGSPEVVSNLLQLGELSAAGGWSIAWMNHNFTDSEIYNSGEFTVSVDIINLGSTGGIRFSGFAVGNSLSDLSNWSANNPSVFTSDFFIGYDPTGTTEVKVFLGGTQDYHQTIDLGSEANLSVRFHSFSSFNAGTNVNYEASINDSIVKTGVFSWSGTNENYINLYSNYSLHTARFDDFEVSAVPEPSTYAFLFGACILGYALWRKRK